MHRSWRWAAALLGAAVWTLTACQTTASAGRVPSRRAVSANDVEVGEGVDFCDQFPDPQPARFEPPPDSGLVVGPQEHILGGEDALMTIILFTDLTSASSPPLVAGLEGVAHDRPEEVRVVFRHAPSGDPAKKAAEATEAAAELGGPDAFWGMVDLLSEGRTAWANLSGEALIDALVGYAEELSLDGAEFRAMLEEGRFAAEIDAAAASARDLDIEGVPSLYVNSVLLYNPPAAQSELDKMVDVVALTMRYPEPPPMVIDPDRFYSAWIATNKGAIAVDLYADLAPQTVNNFAYLACTGYYDGVIWRRVLQNKIAQTGDPLGTGLGAPGYTIPDEYEGSALEFNRPGWLSMARTSQPDSASAQFFITIGPMEHLNGQFTIFGEVVDGMQVIARLNLRDPQSADPQPEGDVVQTITVREIPQD